MRQSIDVKDTSIERRTDDLLALSTVVNRFIDVKRSTIRHGRSETDGEHTLHLQFLAVAYAARYHPELDIGKVALYALVHDFVEVYAGDVNSLGASADVLAKKALTEAVALERLHRELGEAWPELIEAVEHYESLIDPEACFVKSFDKCDPSFSHHWDGGEALRRMGIETPQQLRAMSAGVRRRMPYAEAFPDVLAVREELLSRVVHVAYTEV